MPIAQNVSDTDQYDRDISSSFHLVPEDKLPTLSISELDPTLKKNALRKWHKFILPTALYLWYLYLEATDPAIRVFIEKYTSPNASTLDMMIFTPPGQVNLSYHLVWYSIGKLSGQRDNLTKSFDALDGMDPMERSYLFNSFLALPRTREPGIHQSARKA
ncbi:hypothetical protein TWF788_008235 [Orbilia oligospora]|uniref:Uncharacterized protein n=1 Tax=Orbilia oligospora TaxID=2813651 RepID=A0A7C8Q2U8_ORBOL|nr:hypothetical protein TWF788_008235 [Orbilia oligospora]